MDRKEAQRLRQEYEESLKKYAEEAAIDDPDGSLCGFCGKVNDFADDCGFFYCSQEDKKLPCLPTCLECWRGEVGSRHIRRYGLGSR